MSFINLHYVTPWLLLIGNLVLLTVQVENNPALLFLRPAGLVPVLVDSYLIWKGGVLGRLKRLWNQAGRQREEGEEVWVGWGTAAGDVLVVASTVRLAEAVFLGRREDGSLRKL